MLKAEIIGHLGKDAVVHQNGIESVVNFSVAHKDKFKNAAGVVTEKTTWIECSWWIDSQSPVIQYLKTGVQVYVEGVPGAKMWENKKENKMACGLGLRVYQLQLLGGGRREDYQNQPASQQPAPVS